MRRRSRKRVRRLVVAAVVRRDDGRFLLSRRLPDSHLGGLWEFPGGAVEDGESPADALRREFLEELGVDITVEEPITFAFHRDQQRDVVLLFYETRIVSGVPVGKQGQEVTGREGRRKRVKEERKTHDAGTDPGCLPSVCRLPVSFFFLPFSFSGSPS